MAMRLTVLALVLISLVTGCAFGEDALVNVQGTLTITTR